MSYDASMMIDTGGAEPAEVCDIGNMTSNVSHMWTRALGFRLAEMGGWSGQACQDPLEKAVADIKDPENREEYEAMNPTNGWGDVGSATKFLEKILSACIRHPKATLWLGY